MSDKQCSIAPKPSKPRNRPLGSVAQVFLLFPLTLSGAVTSSCGHAGVQPEPASKSSAAPQPAPTCRWKEQVLTANEASSCQKLCDSGDQNACAVQGLSLMNMGPKNRPAALELLRGSCAAKVAVGCGAMGLFYWRGWVVPADRRRALELYEGACADGDGISCESLGGVTVQLLGSGGQTPTKEQYRRITGVAVRWWSKACKLGRHRACGMVGAVYFDRVAGSEAERSSKMVKVLVSACQTQGESCRLLGDIYQAGDTVTADVAHAQRLYKKACRLGSQSGCAKVAGRP